MTLDKGLRAMPFADRDVCSERPACSLSRIRMTQASDARNFVPSFPIVQPPSRRLALLAFAANLVRCHT